jgi:hypothetical protein
MVVTICLDDAYEAEGEDMRRETRVYSWRTNITIVGVLQRSFSVLYGRILEDL